MWNRNGWYVDSAPGREQGDYVRVRWPHDGPRPIAGRIDGRVAKITGAGPGKQRSFVLVDVDEDEQEYYSLHADFLTPLDNPVEVIGGLERRR